MIRDMKFRITSPLMSKQIQEALFELDAEWVATGRGVLYDSEAEWPAWIYCTEGGIMTKSGMGDAKSDPDQITRQYLTHHIGDLHVMIAKKREVLRIEEGNWYRVNRTDGKYDHDALVYYKGGTSGMYGWSYIGGWTNIFAAGQDLKQLDSSRTVTKASDEDVIERFRHEMKRRGFTDGCRFTGSLSNTQGLGSLSQTQFYDCLKTKVMCGEGNGLIFNDGVWAKVVEGGLPMIAGYIGEWDSTNLEVIYGCKRFSASFILSDGFAVMDSMMVDGNQVKASEMRDVYEFVKANV